MARIRSSGGDFISYGFLTLVVAHGLAHLLTRVHTTLFPTLRIEFNLSLAQLGLVAAIPPLCQSLLSIPTGLLSDRIGSRRLISASIGLMALGSVLTALAQSPAMLIAALSLTYICSITYHPAAYSYISRLFKPSERSKALGLHGSGATLGIALGPLSVSLIMGVLALGWRQVYFLWVVPLLLGAIAAHRIQSEPGEDVAVGGVDKGKNPPVTSLRSASLVMFLVFLSMETIARSTFDSFVALYLVDYRGVSQALAGLLVGSNALVGVVAAPLGGLLATRYGEKRWVLAVYALASGCFVLTIASPNNAISAFLYVSYGFFRILGMAANSAIMAMLSPGKQRGLAYALFFLPGSVMGAVAPFAAGSLAQVFGLTTVFYAVAAVAFVSLGVLQFGVRLPSSGAR
ncbi:MAG: MFS transporter [Anaerolineae bacterium]